MELTSITKSVSENLEVYILFGVTLPIMSAAIVHKAIVPIQREILPWPVALYVFCIPLYLAPIWLLFFL